MLIRVKGYHDGGKEYLEEGKKSGRDLSREELDERVILYGDLDLTQMIYRQIPDKGQERYVSFTLSFREECVANETLLAITERISLRLQIDNLKHCALISSDKTRGNLF